jgi:hypothetical protein
MQKKKKKQQQQQQQFIPYSQIMSTNLTDYVSVTLIQIGHVTILLALTC